MHFYYAGINNNLPLSDEHLDSIIIDKFTKVNFDGLTGVEIGWNYLLLWKEDELFISDKITESEINDHQPKLLLTPELSGRCKAASPGIESIIIQTDRKIWLYKFYEKIWKNVPNFVYSENEDEKSENVVKIVHSRCTVALTDLGRVFNVPTLVDMPKRTKFMDIACGFDHTILLAENGDVFSMGMGTRGQLGHGDLEDCDNPKCIEALAGLKIVQISAGGWHSAVITDQGDLYTWGWNTHGELGISKDESKISGTPMPVDFKNDGGKILEVPVKKVRCGNTFTVCMLDDGSIWGCGSNKYGQLGQPVQDLQSAQEFVALKIDLGNESIKDFQCREWGTCITTN